MADFAWLRLAEILPISISKRLIYDGCVLILRKGNAMQKRVGLLAIVVMMLVAVFAYKYYQTQQSKAAKAAFKAPPTVVSAVKAQALDWQDYISSVANLEAKHGTDLNTQVDGVVSQINFKSGQSVVKGTVLLTLDSSVLEAELASAQAAKNLKEVTFKRYEKIVSSGAVTDDQRDTARAEFKQAEAVVKQLEAKIAQMKIVAPFDGKLGIRQVNLGQYIPSGTLITNLQSVTPILADFSISVRDLPKVKVGLKIEFFNDIDTSKAFSGTITAIDAKINEQTRSIDVQAQIDNQANALFPGMFGTVNILLPKKEDTVVLPQSAVTYTLYGDIAFVLTPQKDAKDLWVAKQRMIQVGTRRQDKIAITSGLKAGEYVVTSGQLKLHNGSIVSINNKVSM